MLSLTNRGESGGVNTTNTGGISKEASEQVSGMCGHLSNTGYFPLFSTYIFSVD